MTINPVTETAAVKALREAKELAEEPIPTNFSKETKEALENHRDVIRKVAEGAKVAEGSPPSPLQDQLHKDFPAVEGASPETLTQVREMGERLSGMQNGMVEMLKNMPSSPKPSLKEDLQQATEAVEAANDIASSPLDRAVKAKILADVAAEFGPFGSTGDLNPDAILKARNLIKAAEEMQQKMKEQGMEEEKPHPISMFLMDLAGMVEYWRRVRRSR